MYYSFEFCNYRKADDYKKVPEGGDHDADGHEDGDEDREHHAEGGGPAGGPAVLKIRTSDSANILRCSVKHALGSDSFRLTVSDPQEKNI